MGAAVQLGPAIGTRDLSHTIIGFHHGQRQDTEAMTSMHKEPGRLRVEHMLGVLF